MHSPIPNCCERNGNPQRIATDVHPPITSLTLQTFQPSDEDCGSVSLASLQGILHSILADSGSHSSIRDSTRDGSCSIYGDDFSDDTADSVNEGEVEPSTGKDTCSLAHPNCEEKDEGVPRVGQPHDIVKNGKTMAHCTAKRGCVEDPHYVCSDGHGEEHGLVSESQRRDIDCIELGRAQKEDTHTCNSRQKNDHNNAGHHDTRCNGISDSINDVVNNSKNSNSEAVDGNNRRQEAQSLVLCNRWPTHQSVRSSSAYMFYACLAGDCPAGSCLQGLSSRGTWGGQQQHLRRRRRRRWRPKAVRIRRQERPLRSPQKNSSRTVHENGLQEEADDSSRGLYFELSCGRAGGGDAGVDAANRGVDGGRSPWSSPTVTGQNHHHKKETSSRQTNYRRNKDINCCSSEKNGMEKNFNGPRTPVHHYSRSGWYVLTKGQTKYEDGVVVGSGGVDCSDGLPILERDMRGAMIAVWLAWGVRIDATRERFKIEEGRLVGVHRAETAKVTYRTAARVSSGRVQFT